MRSDTRAVLLMLLSATSFGVMGAFVKAAGDVGTIDKVVARNLVTLLVAALLVRHRGSRFVGALRHQPLLLGRSLLGICGVAAYFYAIDHLYLADAAMLTKLSPFFVAVFAGVFLREKLRLPVVAALVIGFLGGMLVVKPRFDVTVVPALIGMSSAVFAGGAYTLLRALRSREAAETIVLHFSLTTVVVLSPLVVAGFRPPTLADAGSLLGIGVAAAGGQLGLTAAYRHAPAAEVSLYSYATILVSALIGLLVWGEVPDRWSLLGGLLILAGGTWVWLASRHPAPP